MYVDLKHGHTPEKFGALGKNLIPNSSNLSTLVDVSAI